MQKFNTAFQALGPDDIQQSFPDTCAIKAQQIILEHHGISMTEDQLVQESIDNGWYYPGSGTSMSDVGNLLELHGIEVERHTDASIKDITESIAKGNSVIIGVDSGELWQPCVAERMEDYVFGPNADHALIASGVIIDPLTGTQEILLTDPGTGDMACAYDMDTFMDAWEDSGNYMLAIL